MKAIHAIYEGGVFKPTEPVDLPERCPVNVEPLFEASRAPIESVLADLALQVPAEEWDNLPSDLTDKLDEYLSGGEGA